MDIDAALAALAANLTALLPRLLAVAIVLGLSLFFAGRLQRLVLAISERSRLPLAADRLLAQLARIVVLVAGALVALDILGLSNAALSFVASLGVVGLIVGFALQDITKQFAAGAMLLLAQPFQVGDRVRIGQHEGVITQVQLRATSLQTDVGDEVLIPNADVYSSAIVNFNRYDRRRRTVQLRLPAASPDDGARAALLAAAAATPGVAAEPAPVVVATGLDGDSALLELRYWIEPGQAEPDAVTTSVVLAARRALGAAGGAPDSAGS